MGYRVKFNTTIEWEVNDEDMDSFDECATPEAFIKYQEYLLKPAQSLGDFVANAVVKRGDWAYETDDAVEDMGEWHGV